MKRREIFRQLKNKKCLILFLQEVHYSKDKEVIWCAEWGYTAIFSSLSNGSVGVRILFNNVFEFQLLKTNSDPNGRFVINDIKTDSKTLTLVIICVPNNIEPSFVESVLKIILTLIARNACRVAILALSGQKDKQGGRPVTHQKSREKV